MTAPPRRPVQIVGGRFCAGEIVYIRCKVVGAAENYRDHRTTPTVVIVDRVGNVTDNAVRYVLPSDLIKVSEMIQAIQRASGQ